jgi:hypothetical protein
MLHELVVLSHLRWTFVWQRPQQLISRLAPSFDRVWFVEEPHSIDGALAPAIRTEQHGAVTRVWLEIPGTQGPVGFNDWSAAFYADGIAALLAPQSKRTAWLYTPMALDIARSIRPEKLSTT